MPSLALIAVLAQTTEVVSLEQTLPTTIAFARLGGVASFAGGA